jgi:predicted nucleic acid-binding protein
MMPSSRDHAFLDANIPIFAGGKPSRLQESCRQILHAVVDHPGKVLTSSEVLQELLHVYLRRGEISKARAAISEVVEAIGPAIEPVLFDDVVTAAAMDVSPRLQARDRIHLAVMQRLGITRIISSDRAFDIVPSIERLDPSTFAEWRDQLFAPAN